MSDDERERAVWKSLRESSALARATAAAAGPISITVDIGEEAMAHMNDFIAKEAARACIRCRGTGQSLQAVTPATYVWGRCPLCEDK